LLQLKLFIDGIHFDVWLNLSSGHRLSIARRDNIIKTKDELEGLSADWFLVNLLRTTLADNYLLKLFHDLDIFNDIWRFCCDQDQK
jgi:hypothetical protein